MKRDWKRNHVKVPGGIIIYCEDYRGDRFRVFNIRERSNEQVMKGRLVNPTILPKVGISTISYNMRHLRVKNAFIFENTPKDERGVCMYSSSVWVVIFLYNNPRLMLVKLKVPS